MGCNPHWKIRSGLDLWLAPRLPAAVLHTRTPSGHGDCCHRWPLLPRPPTPHAPSVEGPRPPQCAPEPPCAPPPRLTPRGTRLCCVKRGSRPRPGPPRRKLCSLDPSYSYLTRNPKCTLTTAWKCNYVSSETRFVLPGGSVSYLLLPSLRCCSPLTGR